METLHTKKDLHLNRKLVHVLVGVLIAISLLYAPIDKATLHLIVICITLLGLGLELFRLKHSAFNTFLLKRLSMLARQEEEEKFSGLFYYFLALSICLFWTPRIPLAALFLIQAFADPIASIIGVKYSRKNQKSFKGSLCFLIIALFISFIFFAESLFLMGTIPLAATLIEHITRFDDNLTVPLGCSLIIYGHLSFLH